MTLQRFGIAAVLAILATGIYLNTLDNHFVYDDRVTVIGNPSLRDLSNFEYVLVHQRFRPLTNLSYALDYAAWELEPFGYHATNIAIHVLNVLLLFALVIQLTADDRRSRARTSSLWLPGVAAALFATHPLMTQAVAYVTGRSELLCTAFFLTALLCVRPVLQFGRWRWGLPALLAWAASLACKETAAMLPLVVLAWDRLLVTPNQPGWNKRLLRLHAPLLCILAVGGLARMLTYQFVETNPTGVSVWANLPTQAIALWRYLWLLVFPVQQSLIHPLRGVETFLDPWALLAAIGLIAVGASVWFARKRWPLASLGAIWFFAALAPTTLIPLAEPMSEHRLYLANAGAFLVVALAFARGISWLERSRPQVVLPAWALAGCLLVVLCVATVTRNGVWQDPVSLWTDAARKAPLVFAPHYALGDALREVGDCERAIPEYRRALVLVSTHPDARNKLGLCLFTLGRTNEARAEFQSVLLERPEHVYAIRNLIRIEYQEGNLDRVHGFATLALEVDPDNLAALALLREIETYAAGKFGSTPTGTGTGGRDLALRTGEAADVPSQ